jgi:hypothetical protein
MIRRRLLIAGLVLAAQLILAAPVLAADDGEGLAGETNDKIITFFALGVLLFFTLVIILGSVLQNALQKRKDARMEAHRRGRHGW